MSASFSSVMPHIITLEYLPAGYATRSARVGDEIDIACREFTSTEDGQLFISRLEGTPTQILEKIAQPSNSAASATNSLPAIIRRDKTAKVHWERGGRVASKHDI